MRKFVLAAAAVAATAVFSTQANAAGLMTKMTSQGLSDMLTAAGATEVKITKPEAGVEIVSANDGSGTMNFVLLNCAADGCPSLQMTAMFNKDDRFTLAAVNGYNYSYLNAHASLSPSGEVLLVRHFVSLGGVTEDNLKANIAIFALSPDQFSKHILSQVTASLDKPTMKPASAEPAKALKPSTLKLPAPETTGEQNVMKWLSGQTGRSIP